MKGELGYTQGQSNESESQSRILSPPTPTPGLKAIDQAPADNERVGQGKSLQVDIRVRTPRH